MAFTPPIPTPEKPHVDGKSLQNVDRNNPKVKKYSEKYRGLEEQAAKEMADKIAKEKHKKRVDFLIELVKAAIIAILTLVIEHFMDIIRFFQSLLFSE